MNSIKKQEQEPCFIQLVIRSKKQEQEQEQEQEPEQKQGNKNEWKSNYNDVFSPLDEKAHKKISDFFFIFFYFSATDLINQMNKRFELIQTLEQEVSANTNSWIRGFSQHKL